MLGHLDPATVLSSQNIVRTIALIIDVFGAHERPDPTVLVVGLQVVAVGIVIVVVIEQVVGGAALVFLASVELVFLHVEDLRLFDFNLFHVFKSADLSVVSFLTEMSPSVLNMLELLLSNFLICDSKVLVKALLFRDEVTRGRVWIVHLRRVDIFMVTACTLAKTRILNQLFIFHCGLKQTQNYYDEDWK